MPYVRDKYVALDCGCHRVERNGKLHSRIEQFSEKGKQGFQYTLGAWKEVRGTVGHSGYVQVSIHGKTRRLNRIIAMAFIPNPLHLPEVQHIDGIRTHNRVSNLKWGNPKQNALDREAHGNTRRGSKHGNSKLDEVKAVGIFLAEGSLNHIAERFKISKKSVLLIKQKKTWKHIHSGSLLSTSFQSSL